MDMPRWLVVVLVLPVAAACGSDAKVAVDDGPPPTDQEAESVLDRAVELVDSGDLKGLCELTSSQSGCEADLATYPDVPATAPEIVQTRVLPGRDVSEESSIATMSVLTLCGVDGAGRPYQTDAMFVSNPDGSTDFMNPVFWSGKAAVVPSVNPDDSAGGSIGSGSDLKPDMCA